MSSDVSDEATCPQEVVRVGLVEFGERHDTQTNGQHYTPQQTGKHAWHKLNGEFARYARHLRSILARMSRVSGVTIRTSRGRYEETAFVEFQLYRTTVGDGVGGATTVTNSALFDLESLS